VTMKSKSEDRAFPKSLDDDKRLYYRDVAGFLVFVAVVVIAYYVAVSLR
jgi:hypothetical protein